MGLPGSQVYIIICLIMLCLLHHVKSYFYYPSVFWTPNNCRFNLNKENEAGYEFNVKPFGSVSFVCPNIALWNDISATGPHLSMMYENLMLVDKDGYDTCTVNKKRNPSLNRLLLKCDGDAKKLRFITEKFAPQRAIQDKIKYLSGKTYYFIATSNGSKESVNNLSGGRCKTHHMKLKIKVCHDSDPCPFIQPKCPYSSVGKKTKTTTSTTLATTTTTKLNMTLPASTAKTTLQRTTSSKNRILSTTESQKQAIEMLKKKAKTSLTSKAVQLSSQESLWGAPRKHIIIHITMSLIILILALSLIYVLITRRKRKSKPMAFTSKLYNERPMSALPLDEDFNRDSRIGFNRDSRIDFNRDSRNV